MGGHVIRTFLIVIKTGVAVGDEVADKFLEIVVDAWIGVLTNDQRRARVLNKNVADAVCDGRFTE